MLALLLSFATPSFASTRTTTTNYTYNADGAPVAITEQAEAAAATTYLTWDNYSPQTGTPTTGVVSAGDGNLVGIGDAAGIVDQFGYDVRDRLTACSRPGRPAASYDYDAVSLLATATFASGDGLDFYFDTGATPRMINIVHPATAAAASVLGPVRYLSDGSEQILLAPRKDTAGVYDAGEESLSPYAYAPYGSGSSDPLAATTDTAAYDLSPNPFQYAGEYRDPACDAYYLRARWYLPAQQTFLSRDPGDWLHRYSYTAGNPVGRVDPSGLKFTGADFSRDVDHVVGRLTPGKWAYVEPLLPVWGQMLGGIELAGLLPTFWHHPTTQGWITFGFLSASIVAEAGAETSYFDRLAPFQSNATRAAGVRTGIDLTLGSSQTLAQSDQHGRIDQAALVQGIETTTSGIFWSRYAAGVGYRPHNMTSGDVDDMVVRTFRSHSADAASSPALVYLARNGRDGLFTTPWRESRSLGSYHEYVVAITAQQHFYNELRPYEFEGAPPDDRLVVARAMRWGRYSADDVSLLGGLPSGHNARFVGVVDAAVVDDVMRHGNPFGVPTYAEQMQSVWDRNVAASVDESITSQAHARAIVRLLRSKSQ